MTPISTPLSGVATLGTASTELLQEISLLQQEIKRQQKLLNGENEEIPNA